MTDTTVADALVWPQDEGSGVSDGNEDYDSAAYLSLLSRYTGNGSYVGDDMAGSATLQFNDIDTANGQVDVGTGHAYISESGQTVQSGAQQTYDTTVPTAVPYVVILPSEVTDLGLGTDTDNDVWLALDPTANDSVFIRHGNGLSAPSEPSVKLGTVNSDTGATTRPNDLSEINSRSISAADSLTDPAGVSHTAELADLSDTGGVKYLRSTEPSSPSLADTWYDTDNGIYRVYADLGSGAEWHPVPPVQITEEASTLTESTVTISHNNTQITNGSVELLSEVTIDDFEDGNTSVENRNWGDWVNNNTSFTAQTGTVISGTYSGDVESSSEANETKTTRSSKTTKTFAFKTQIGSDTGDGTETLQYRFNEGLGSDDIGSISFVQDGGNVIWDTFGVNSDIELLPSWSAGTTYTIEMEWDFSNDQVDIVINGTTQATDAPFIGSPAGFDLFRIKPETTNSSSTQHVYIDDLKEGSVKTSGDVLVEWGSGNPTDIQDWIDVGYQATPDGETVTIDVENGSGTVLESDIGNNYPLDTDPDVDAADNIKLRANLSRTDTSNDPAVDYFYRRFTR